MAIAGDHKPILDREIEMYESFLETALMDIKEFVVFNTRGYIREGQDEHWIYENRMTSFQYNELIEKADGFAKKLTELRDSKMRFLSSF